MKYLRPAGLPEFRDPPVVNVRMEMVFEPLDVRVTDLPRLMAVWGDRYPNMDERAPRPLQLEQEEGAAPRSLRIEFADVVRIPMIRFSDPEQSRWIELQSDRMSCGWSRSGEETYPRYEGLRQDFETLASELAQFADHTSVQVVQLSLVYRNEFAVSAKDPLAGLCDGFDYQTPAGRFDDLPAPQSAGLMLQFPYRDEEDHVYARLYARSTVRKSTGGSHARFDLRFTGDPFDMPGSDDRDGFESILAFFDEGHEAIVRAFAQATSRQLHEKWGRYDS